jgi:hypothetical protein
MRRLLCLVLAFGLASNSGCALLIRGSTQPVNIDCASPNVRITVDGNAVSPGTLVLTRGDEHIVVADAPGCRQYRKTIKSEVTGGLCLFYSAFVYVTCCFIVGLPLLIPLLIDGANGALNELVPDSLMVQLVPEEPATPSDPWPPSQQVPAAAPAPTPAPAEKAQATCAYCGLPVSPGDKECPHCGAKLR